MLFNILRWLLVPADPPKKTTKKQESDGGPVQVVLSLIVIFGILNFFD